MALLAVAGIVCLGLAMGCTKRQPAPAPVEELTPAAESPVKKAAAEAEPVAQPAPQPAANAAPKPAAAVDDVEKCEAAVRQAVQLSAERRYAEALAALQAARAIQDTDMVRQEIERLEALLDRQTAAERAVEEIQALVSAGRAEEAARLAATALQQFGDTDQADRLARLKRQADTLVGVQVDDPKARFDRFHKEGEAALEEQNLRAAALAFDQALAAVEDADLRRRLEEVQARLARYDENRQHAAELRRDPAALEEALARLEEAAQAWDTLQVRHEIADCRLALAQRRDRLSVAEFEVRGDVGIPFAGRTLADDLLPAFQNRFDLVERAQLEPILEELKLPADELAGDPAAQRELGRLAKVRYLVLGSVTRDQEITVRARLVEVPSGLVVQTARIVAQTPAELRRLLPQLARLLLMTDEEKLALEERQAAPAKLEPAQAEADVPPPPEPPPPNQPPPPPLAVNAHRPPDPGPLAADDFNRFQPQQAGQLPPPPVVTLPAQDPFRLRLLQVTLQIGDNLFLRGRFRDALEHYTLALQLFPGSPDLLIRLERCRAFLPPPGIVQPSVLRPRLAVIPFVVLGDPRLVPPPLGLWTADNLPPYFYPHYDLVDRGELFWYMGRLGLTVRDLMVNPAARIWLARALNVRDFLLGTIRPTASFDVSTYLIDAEYGFLHGSGRIHVHDAFELRLRLGELARQTLLAPADRLRYLQGADAYRSFVIEARRCVADRQFSLAIGFCRKALALQPDGMAAHALLQQAQEQERLQALQAARRRDLERFQVLRRNYDNRQTGFLRDLGAARGLEGSPDDDADRRRRDRAYDQLVARARQALAQKNHPLAIQLFESAANLKPSDEGFRALAEARADWEEARRAQALAQQAQERQAREKELERARLQLAAQRQQRQDDELARRKAQEEQELAEHARLLDRAGKLLVQKQYDEAAALLQSARRLRRTDELDRLLDQALLEQTRAAARKKGAKESDELERQLAEEKKRQNAAEAQKYAARMQQAEQALQAGRHDEAIAHYQSALKLFRTDAAQAGLRQAEQARDRDRARLDAEQKKQAEEARRKADFQRLLHEGRAALAARQYDQAIQALRQANQLFPGNVDLLADLGKAEQARDEALAQARNKARPPVVKKPDPTPDDAPKLALQQALARARKALVKRDAAEADQALVQAARLAPNDPEVRRLHKELDQLRAALRAEAEARKNQAQVNDLVKTAQTHLAARRFDDALRVLNEANRLQPGDATVAQLIKQVEKARNDAVAEAKKQEEARRRQQYAQLMNQGQSAVNAKRYAEAIQAFNQALKLMPGDAAAAKALREAERLQEADRKPPSPDKNQLAYEQAMKEAAAFERQKNFDRAAQAYREALKFRPNDPRALAGLQQALANQKKKGK
jgi:hypothetical protein